MPQPFKTPQPGVREAWHLTLAEFMGPGHGNFSKAADISDIEAIEYLIKIQEHWKNPGKFDHIPYIAVEWPPMGLGHTMVALVYGSIAGFYAGDRLWVAPAHRNHPVDVEALLVRDTARARGGSVAGPYGNLVRQFSERTAEIHRRAYEESVAMAAAAGEIVKTQAPRRRP